MLHLFDCIGPLAHSVEDAARVLDVIAGFDEKDNTSSQSEKQDYVAATQSPNKNIKIGVPEEFLGKDWIRRSKKASKVF